jgi:hypothetical protein
MLTSELEVAMACLFSLSIALITFSTDNTRPDKQKNKKGGRGYHHQDFREQQRLVASS